MYLQPYNETKELKGSVYYHGPSQAWCLIKLKKEILSELKDLKNKRGDFSYEMLMPMTFSQLDEAVEKTKVEKKAIPFLLWLKKAS
ncbi:MAG: hypothetical protein ABIJ18_01605 [archaeon]